MKSVKAIAMLCIWMGLGFIQRANAEVEGTLPSEYQPNNADAASELEQSWIHAAKQFEDAKRVLISTGHVLVPRDSPPPLNQEGSLAQAGVHENQMKATAKVQAECGLRIAVPENAGYGGTSCFGPKGMDTPFGLVAGLSFDKAVVYGHQIMAMTPREGYKYDDYYVRPTFYIHEHGSFEQSLLKSAQLGADNNGLFMNWRMTPFGYSGPPKATSVKTKLMGGTQMIIGKAVWEYRYHGKTLYSTCIYSLHGHINRSAEALVCFDDVKGKSFTNQYVDEYLKVLESIRLAP